jgi:hypothetical protein
VAQAILQQTVVLHVSQANFLKMLVPPHVRFAIQANHLWQVVQHVQIVQKDSSVAQAILQQTVVLHVLQANIQIKQGWTLVLIVMLANLHQKVHQHATNVPRDSSEQLTVQMRVRNVLQVSMRMLLD